MEFNTEDSCAATPDPLMLNIVAESSDPAWYFKPANVQQSCDLATTVQNTKTARVLHSSSNGLPCGLTTSTGVFTDVLTKHEKCIDQIPKFITRTWTYTDECGRLAAPYEQIITLVDDVAPEFAEFPADITIDILLDHSPKAAGFPSVVDSCDTESEITFEDVVTYYNLQNIEQSEDSDGLKKDPVVVKIDRTFTVVDDCGNSRSQVQVISLSSNPCILNPCGSHSVCELVDNFRPVCNCLPGFEPIEGTTSCTDINECASEETNICDASSVCHNTEGSYYCETVCTFETLLSDDKNGPCRLADGSAGSQKKDFTLLKNLNIDECQEACLKDETCLAFEAQIKYTRCELWHTIPDHAKKH
eukprot:Awhi_evm1s13335